MTPPVDPAAAPRPAADPARGPRLVTPDDRGGGPPQGGDPYQNADAIHALVERCIHDAAHNSARLERDIQDIGNQRMYRGGAINQWICRLPSNPNTWVTRPYDGPDGLPAWVPRCATNLLANKVDGVVSLLVQSDPAKTARPATDDDSDVAAADVADRVLPVLEEEIGWRRLKREISQLVCLQDKAAIVVYYDNDPRHGTADLPVFQCADCAAAPTDDNFGGLSESFEVDEADGHCPYCGGENLNQAEDPEQPGQVLGLTYAKGKLCAEVVNSLGFSVPSSATTSDAQKLPWVLLHDTIEPEVACRQWPKHAEHIRAVGGRGKGGTHQSSAFAEELRTMSSPTSANLRGGGQGGKSEPILVYRLQHDPIDDGPDCRFPDGLYAVRIGDQVIESGPLPVTDSRTGQKRKSILIRTYRDMPGSAYGKPVADDLFPLQAQYNQLETLAFMSAMHHAAPTVFLPNSVTLEDDLTGQPGATVRYRTHDGSKPAFEQGSGVHPTVYELMDRTEQKMDLLSGLNGVLQGSRPEGGKATAFEVQALQERGMAAFRTPLECATTFEQELAVLCLDIARDSIWVPRFQKVMGDNGQWEVEQFLGSDLTGHVDIVIEPMSAWPKSPMLQDTRLTRAVELGILNPAADPEVAASVLDMMSLGNLKKSLSEDKKQVARELDRWRAATMPQEIAPPNLAIIEPGIHLFLKKQFLKSEQVEKLAAANPPLFEAMVQHVQALQMALQPPPMADPNAPPSGDAVNAAVESGALVPEGKPQDPMEAAVQGGALQPEMPAPAGPSIDDLMAAGALAPAPPEERPQ